MSWVLRRLRPPAMVSGVSSLMPHRDRRSGLWTNRDFLHLWTAETISQFGSQVTPVAVPLLAALTLDASPGSAPRSGFR